jgi:FAD/FMN-containing dehydrogenase
MSVNENVARLVADLGDVPYSVEPSLVRRKSRDYFWYSQALAEDLKDKRADVIVTPRDEADVIRLASAAARHRVPVTPRGGGTGNYGQSVPLAGGVLLDMSEMTEIERVEPGLFRVKPGARMHLIDEELRPFRQELRLHPSTKRTATIGGFVAGGSGGVGSVTWGGLREPGNVIAARVVTLEKTPRVLELRGDSAQIVNRAYGTTGIITALELPLAPSYAWVDLAIAFDDFAAACAFGLSAALADGIVKKLLTPVAWPLPSYFGPFAEACPKGRSLLLAMIAKPSLESFKALLGSKGEIIHEAAFDESPDKTPIYEYAWNHTTLQVLKHDRTFTYQQCLFPHDRLLDSVAEMVDLFADEVWHHLEFIRFGGRMTASALPVVRFTTRARLFEIVSIYEQHGVMVANPHVYTLEDGSRHKRADADQLGFKRQADPHNLLNPGKMRSYEAGEP